MSMAQMGKDSACNVGDLGSIPGLGKSLGEGDGNPLRYSCLENPMDRGAWQATVHGVAKTRTQVINSYFDISCPQADKVVVVGEGVFQAGPCPFSSSHSNATCRHKTHISL